MGLHFLSDNDVRILQELINAWKGGRINAPSRPPHERSFSDREDHQAPETYIAFPQDGDGIPGLTPAVGTAPDDYDEPGVATCDIYRVIIVGNTPLLQPIDTLEKEVYNLSENPVPQDWVAVTRDKFGQWVAFVPGSARMVHGTLAGVDPDALGTGSPFNDLETTDATFHITSVVAIFGAGVSDEETGTGDTLLIHNVHNFSGTIGARVTAVYCRVDERWECIQIDC